MPPSDPKPIAPDWRLFAYAHLAEDFAVAETGEVIPKGSRATICTTLQLAKNKQTSISLPNATSLMLNASARAYLLARSLREHTGVDRSLQHSVTMGDDSLVFDYIEHMIESIVLAFTAIEAFTNEAIPHDYVYTHVGKNGVTSEQWKKPEIERRLHIDDKLGSLLPDIFKTNSPKGSRCWQGYRLLRDVRDRIIHMKSDDRRSTGPEIETVWKAIFLVPAPHRLAKEIVDHFIKAMPKRPNWHLNYPH